jgi:hypothetical protein
MKNIDQLRHEYLEEVKDFSYCFAETMWCKVKRMQKLKSEGKESSNVYKKVREALSDDLKKFTDQSYTPYASVNAYSMFKELEMGHIFEHTWHSMGSGKILKALGQKGRDVFHFEHLQPHSEYIDKFLINCTDSHDVYRSLQDYPGVCWITKEEDRLISSLGHRSNRLEEGGWREVYKKANIQTVSILDSNCSFK